MKPTEWVSWLLIVLVCIGVPVLRATSTKPNATESPSVDTGATLKGRYLVGAAHAAPFQTSSLANTLKSQKPDNEVEAIENAVILGEIEGRKAALDALGLINTETSRAFAGAYEVAATTAPATAPVEVHSPIDLSSHRERFGWYADLAESFGRPDTDPLRARVNADARRTFVAAIVALVGVGIAGLAGLALLITAIVLLAGGKLRLAVTRPHGSATAYVEAFAIYIVGVLAAGIAIGWAFPHAKLWTHILAMFGVVIIAILWPTMRGVPFADQRRDWGVHTGRGLFIEAGCGICGYLAGLPIIAVGMLITVLLLKISGTTATHPIVQELDMNPILLLGIASVFAPITEELLFRGILLSHLRAAVGAVWAALISGVVFAAVHPQGWAVVPALAGIGFVLAMIRQWRGSLVPSMIAHALHNGVLLGTVLIMTH